MPATTRRAKIAALRRGLISSERWVDALLVVESHAGEEIFRVGGCWDTRLYRYDHSRPCKPHVIRLEESQLEAARELGKWIAETLAKKRRRIRSLWAGGNRGSGKTFLMGGIALVAIGLAFPGCWMMAVNITAKQRRECLEHIKAVAHPSWITRDIGDFRDLKTEFLTQATVQWLSAQNPRAIRSAGLPIRYVLINEGQDQPEAVFTNAIAAIRNTGGLVGVATNPPQADRGDWVASVWLAIEAGELNGARFLLENSKNRSVDQDALSDIGEYLRVVNPDAYAADAEGIFKLSGPVAYGAFKALPLAKGGHLGEPPELGWTDVTLELTAAATESGTGYPYVCGVDWQKTPGVVGQLAKLYRDDVSRRLVLHVVRTIAVRGVESDFSQALFGAGFVPKPGMPGVPLLIVGDATGARQNSSHNWELPTSYVAIGADGWMVIPPDTHWKTGRPWNPFVRDSRAQMHELFDRHQIQFGAECKEPCEGFPSLVESMRRAKVGPKGGLIEKGDFQHGPDGVRYLAWRFLPRPQVEQPKGIDTPTFNMLRAIRPFG
jgi:hypothetical protein